MSGQLDGVGISVHILVGCVIPRAALLKPENECHNCTSTRPRLLSKYCDHCGEVLGTTTLTSWDRSGRKLCKNDGTQIPLFIREICNDDDSEYVLIGTELEAASYWGAYNVVLTAPWNAKIRELAEEVQEHMKEARIKPPNLSKFSIIAHVSK